MNAQLTPTGRAILDEVKKQQLAGSFKKVGRVPSTGDVFEGLLRKFGKRLKLPVPGRAPVAVKEGHHVAH